MANLVLKDILIQKKGFLTSIIFAVIMVTAFQGNLGNGAYLMGAMGIVFVLIAGAFMYDEKSKGDALMNSLPIKRNEIVVGRYLSLIVFSVIAIALVTIAGMVIKMSGFGSGITIISPSEIAGIFFLLVLIFSIYIPIYFKFGYVKSRVVNIILYAALFGVSGLLSGIRKAIVENPDDIFTQKVMSALKSIPDWMVGPMFVILILLILIASIGLSTRFYIKREF